MSQSDRPIDAIDRSLRHVAPETVGELTEAGIAPLAELGAQGEEQTRRSASLWGDAWRRLVRNRLAVIGMVIVVGFVIVAIAGPGVKIGERTIIPAIAPYGESEVVDVRLARYSPSWTWPFGLDANGRDIFSRVLYGARVSLLVGVVAYIIILAIAIPIGSVAGYCGGTIDLLLMRFVDVISTIPQVLLVLMFVNWRGPGLTNIFLAIGLIGWVTEVRLIRGQFLTLREQDYIKASRVAGAGGFFIVLRHLLPNSMTPIIVAATFGIPTAIFIEAAISFVGVGIRPPQASWGQMVGSASQPGIIQTDPHMLLFPTLAIGLTMLGFTFLGDGLRDALDPKGND
jgi:oligopeptide transport system permease protein